MSNKDLATAVSVSDALLGTATMTDVVEALRIACLALAVHEQDHGEVSIDKIFEVMQTEDIDEEMEELLTKGFQNLVGILGTVHEIMAEESPIH